VQVFEDSNIDAGVLANNGQPDSFRLFRDGDNVKVELNGVLVFARALSSLTNLTVNGSNDNDTLIVDLSAGNPLPNGGIVYDGHGTADTIRSRSPAAAYPISCTRPRVRARAASPSTASW
jgi:hypothetical protein